MTPIEQTYREETLRVSLPRGTVLHEGDRLVVEDAKTVVAIVEPPEAVFLSEPPTPQECVLFGYQIGNRHQPLMIADTLIVYPDIAGVEQLLQQHHIPFVRATLPFTPRNLRG